MAPIYSIAPSTIEKDMITALILKADHITFAAIENVLSGMIYYKKGSKEHLCTCLHRKSNWYLYFILWSLRHNREVQYIYSQYERKMTNLRFRFVYIDIVTFKRYGSEIGVLQYCKDEQIVLKGIYWHASYDEAFQDGLDYTLQQEPCTVSNDPSLMGRSRYLVVESVCTCQIPTCLQDDVLLEIDCSHAFKHRRSAPITHYDPSSGAILQYRSCSRNIKMKKVFMFNNPYSVYYKGTKYYIYCMPRPDVWFYSKSSKMGEAFESWDFGNSTAGTYNNIYC